MEDNNLLEKIDKLMDKKLDQFGKKVSQNQRSLHDAQMNKIHTVADRHVFKSKGNEAQHKFNNSVYEKIAGKIQFY